MWLLVPFYDNMAQAFELDHLLMSFVACDNYLDFERQHTAFYNPQKLTSAAATTFFRSLCALATMLSQLQRHLHRNLYSGKDAKDRKKVSVLMARLTGTFFVLVDPKESYFTPCSIGNEYTTIIEKSKHIKPHEANSWGFLGNHTMYRKTPARNEFSKTFFHGDQVPYLPLKEILGRTRDAKMETHHKGETTKRKQEEEKRNARLTEFDANLHSPITLPLAWGPSSPSVMLDNGWNNNNKNSSSSNSSSSDDDNGIVCSELMDKGISRLAGTHSSQLHVIFGNHALHPPTPLSSPNDMNCAQLSCDHNLALHKDTSTEIPPICSCFHSSILTSKFNQSVTSRTTSCTVTPHPAEAVPYVVFILHLVYYQPVETKSNHGRTYQPQSMCVLLSYDEGKKQLDAGHDYYKPIFDMVKKYPVGYNAVQSTLIIRGARAEVKLGAMGNNKGWSIDEHVLSHVHRMLREKIVVTTTATAPKQTQNDDDDNNNDNDNCDKDGDRCGREVKKFMVNYITSLGWKARLHTVARAMGKKQKGDEDNKKEEQPSSPLTATGGGESTSQLTPEEKESQKTASATVASSPEFDIKRRFVMQNYGVVGRIMPFLGLDSIVPSAKVNITFRYFACREAYLHLLREVPLFVPTSANIPNATVLNDFAKEMPNRRMALLWAFALQHLHTACGGEALDGVYPHQASAKVPFFSSGEEEILTEEEKAEILPLTEEGQKQQTQAGSSNDGKDEDDDEVPRFMRFKKLPEKHVYESTAEADMRLDEAYAVYFKATLTSKFAHKYPDTLPNAAFRLVHTNALLFFASRLVNMHHPHAVLALTSLWCNISFLPAPSAAATTTGICVNSAKQLHILMHLLTSAFAALGRSRTQFLYAYPGFVRLCAICPPLQRFIGIDMLQHQPFFHTGRTLGYINTPYTQIKTFSSTSFSAIVANVRRGQARHINLLCNDPMTISDVSSRNVSAKAALSTKTMGKLTNPLVVADCGNNEVWDYAAHFAFPIKSDLSDIVSEFVAAAANASDSAEAGGKKSGADITMPLIYTALYGFGAGSFKPLAGHSSSLNSQYQASMCKTRKHTGSRSDILTTEDRKYLSLLLWHCWTVDFGDLLAGLVACSYRVPEHLLDFVLTELKGMVNAKVIFEGLRGGSGDGNAPPSEEGIAILRTPIDNIDTQQLLLKMLVPQFISVKHIVRVLSALVPPGDYETFFSLSFVEQVVRKACEENHATYVMPIVSHFIPKHPPFEIYYKGEAYAYTTRTDDGLLSVEKKPPPQRQQQQQGGEEARQDAIRSFGAAKLSIVKRLVRIMETLPESKRRIRKWVRFEYDALFGEYVRYFPAEADAFFQQYAPDGTGR